MDNNGLKYCERNEVWVNFCRDPLSLWAVDVMDARATFGIFFETSIKSLDVLRIASQGYGKCLIYCLR